jgi:hypothetical protein
MFQKRKLIVFTQFQTLKRKCVFLPKRSLFLLDMPFFMLLDYF